MLKALWSTLSWQKNSPIRWRLRVLRSSLSDWRRRQAARLGRRRSNATFIGVTGSSAKSTTTALLVHMLAGHAPTRGQMISNTLKPLVKTLRTLSPADKYVVAELGVTGKGDMRPMAELFRPDVSIVTMIGLEHYSAFRSREAVAEEKGHLVEATRPDGIVLLNADDALAMTMASRTTARIVTFGRSEQADYRILSAAASIPDGLSVEIGWTGGTLSLETRHLGEHFALPVVAAVAAALELGVAPDTVRERAATMAGLPNRMEFYETGNGPTFIIDTAKAPNDTLTLAFDALRHAGASSKRVVLGFISDFPGAPRPRYRRAYQAAREVADAVMFVGENAHRSGAPQEDRQSGRFVEMFDVRQAAEYIRSHARNDEIILLKSSQGLHLERVALAWNHDVQCWIVKCGKRAGCRACGLYEFPYEQHGEIARMRRRQRQASAHGPEQ